MAVNTCGPGHSDHPVVRKTKFLQRAAYELSPLVEQGGPVSFVVFVEDQDDSQGWEVTVDSSGVGTHFDGELDVQLNGRICVGGKYEIHSIELDWRADGIGHVVGLEASWEHECLDPGRLPTPPSLAACESTLTKTPPSPTECGAKRWSMS